MTTLPRGRAVRTIPARVRPIIRATELGKASVLKEGRLVLLSDPYGDVAPDRRGLGLYLGDTRVLSTSVLLVEGRTPTLVLPDPGGSSRGLVQMSNPELPDDPMRSVDHSIALPRQSLGIRRSRELGVDRALRERVAITNYTMAPQAVVVRLLLDVDGADIFEVRGRARARRGEQLPALVDADRILFRYEGLDGRELVTEVRLAPAPDEIGGALAREDGSVAVRWSVRLAPGSSRDLGWTVQAGWSDTGAVAIPASVTDDGAALDEPGLDEPGQDEPGAVIESDDELVNLILEQSFADLELLRTPGPGPGEQFVAAGIPWFATLFGRDSLLAGYAALPYRPRIARDALAVLARLQAMEDDPGRDAERGKILHELRNGEMARAGELPFGRYYGSVDATPLWLITLAEHVAWTGDGSLVDRLWPAVDRALTWLDHAPRDADGFLTYCTRAPDGLRHQGWKDSADAIRDRHGGLVDPPIALAEVQAYAVEARRRIAVLARQRGGARQADAMEAEATTLVGRFDERFWQPDLERYAMALGPGGVIADALASNAGHCLWAGIVPPHRAAMVARDLTGASLFSGWGVRTYGSDQPGYNPLGYHTGSVWPHDTALAAAGLKRYGFHAEASMLAWAVLDAARHAPGYRLPELFCGFDRDSIEAPVVHPAACSPQAWAAAAALLAMTSMLGLVPRATAGELEIVRPILPSGLRRVVVRGLRVGTASVDLLFHRWRGTTSAEVLDRRGDVRVTVRL